MDLNFPFPPKLLTYKGADWSRAVKTTIADFLSTYTLHDSHWNGLWTPFNDTHSLAIITLDTVWSAPRITGSAFLLFRFTSLPLILTSTISDTFVGPTIGTASSRPLSKQEIESLTSLALAAASLNDATREPLFDPNLHQTTIETILNDRIVLLHPPAIELLCVDDQCEVKPIPGLPNLPTP